MKIFSWNYQILKILHQFWSISINFWSKNIKFWWNIVKIIKFSSFFLTFEHPAATIMNQLQLDSNSGATKSAPNCEWLIFFFLDLSPSAPLLSRGVPIHFYSIILLNTVREVRSNWKPINAHSITLSLSPYLNDKDCDCPTHMSVAFALFYSNYSNSFDMSYRARVGDLLKGAIRWKKLVAVFTWLSRFWRGGVIRF